MLLACCDGHRQTEPRILMSDACVFCHSDMFTLRLLGMRRVFRMPDFPARKAARRKRWESADKAAERNVIRSLEESLLGGFNFKAPHNADADASIPPIIPEFLKQLYLSLPRHSGPSVEVDDLLSSLADSSLPAEQQPPPSPKPAPSSPMQVAEQEIALETGDVQSEHPNMIHMNGGEYATTGSSSSRTGNLKRRRNEDSDDEQERNGASEASHARPERDVFRQRQMAKLTAA